MVDWTFESTVALEPSSTLEYLNSQLVSQGYVPSPGLQLQVLQGKDQERVIRCILSLLSQRVDDLRRFETATSKLKTQSFDLERMRSMWRDECEKSSNAEKEMTLYKSKLTGAQKHTEELQKKCQQTLAELSRSRSTLQTVRQGAMMEIKRKEKEVERMLDRFQKLAGSGSLRVTGHGTVEEAIPLQVLNKEEQGLFEEALGLAEEELNVLKGERERLHDVFIWTARELSAIIAEGTEINPKSCIANPVETFTPLLSTIRLRLLAKKPDDAEYSRLQSIIAGLTEEVEDKEKLLRKFEDHFAAMKERSAVDVSGSEELSRERARLDIYRLELEEERKRIASAGLELEDQRASLEADRMAAIEVRQTLEEEQRSIFAKPSPQQASSSQHRVSAISEILIPPTASTSSPPRKRKPRGFPVGSSGHSPTKSPKRRRAAPPAPAPSLPPPRSASPTTQQSLSDLPTVEECEEETYGTPLLVTTPPFSPLPSPPGALSLNGIGLEVVNELTPIQPMKRFPKHAYSPARPSPLCQPMKISMSDTSFDGEQDSQEMGVVLAQIQKAAPGTSSFPAMPAGLAKKLGVVDKNVDAPAPRIILDTATVKGKEKTEALENLDQISKPLDSRSSKINGRQEEKENEKAQPRIGVKKSSTSGGARRVPISTSSSKGSWR